KSAGDRGPARQPAQTESRADAVARGIRADDDPLQQTPRRATVTGKALLPDAEKAFADKRYREADDLFARVYGADAADEQHAPQWAYCKLHTVVAKLKQAEAAQTPVAAGEWER